MLKTLQPFYLMGMLVLLVACKKTPAREAPTDPEPSTPDPDTVTIRPQTDPPLAATVGFFMDPWLPRNFEMPASFTSGSVPATASLIIRADRSQVTGKVPPTLFGNNANTWMTQMVDQPVLMNHLRQNRPGIIRFPGGSISDLFFWNALPDQPPATAPAQLRDAAGNPAAAGYWYGRNTASWTLSVDNYYQMLEQTGNQGLITINYGYARYGTGANPVADAAHLAADWVRYDKGRVRYWEIGNEIFGSWEAGYRINTSLNQDGQPEYVNGQLYGQHFKVFADSMRKAAAETGARIYIGAVIRDAVPASWETATFKTWNEGAIPAIAGAADFYVTHNYYTPYHTNSTAAEIMQSAGSVTRQVMQYVRQQLQDHGAALKPVVMDEWNIFATGSGQMVSHISGLHASAVLAEMLQQDYGLACRWDLANAWEDGNDHGWFSQGDDPGGIARWTPRPAFYHMYYFQRVLGDRSVQVQNSNADLKAYVSSFSSGEMGAVLINSATTAKSVELQIDNFLKGDDYYWYTLNGGTDNGAFSRQVYVNGKGPAGVAGGPADYTSIPAYRASAAQGIRVTVPAQAAVYLVVDHQ
ncbi:hypothetical protein GCM10027051_35650 [Niabella terrae]